MVCPVLVLRGGGSNLVEHLVDKFGSSSRTRYVRTACVPRAHRERTVACAWRAAAESAGAIDRDRTRQSDGE